MKKRWHIPGWLTQSLLVLAMLAMLPSYSVFGDCPIDKEYAEALKQTEEEFEAFSTSMKEGSDKLGEILKNYQEYEDAVFSQNPEKGIQLAKKLFNLTDEQTDAAKDKVWQLRDMFNKMDANGVKSKLEDAAGKLEFGCKVAGEVKDAYEFARKFNPANAKDNPTYGLRLIGDILKEGAGKFESIPLVGQILGPWVKAYGEVAGDFANALDRLSKKIQDFRQGSLCGQSGVWLEQQTAFSKAQAGSDYAGEDCLTYFSIVKFPRIRCMVFEGNGNYFLFDPSSCEGYFSPFGTTEKIYDWHGMLINPRRLTADWLSGRARSFKPEFETTARQNAALFMGWLNRSDKGWLLLEAMGMLSAAEELAIVGEEPFVANYILDKNFKSSADKILEAYRTNIYADGSVYADEGQGKKPAQGASVSLNVGGNSKSTTTDGSGQYVLWMKGEPGLSSEMTITKNGFDDVRRSGTWPEQVVAGWNFELLKEAATFTVSGTVYDTSGGRTIALDGASVTATSSSDIEVGSATTAGGAYQLTATAPDGALISVTATKNGVSGSNSFVSGGGAKAGLDIMLDMSKAQSDAPTGPSWTIVVKVIDLNGVPLPGAVISGGPQAVTTDAAGMATVGPISADTTADGRAASVTLSATIAAEGDVKVLGSSATVTYDGQPSSSVTLSIPVEMPTEVTISGRVTDVNGQGIEGAAVTTDGGLATATGGSGSYSLGPVTMTGGKSISIQASYTDGTNAFAGGPVTVTYEGTGKSLSATTIVLSLGQFQEVTISGRVMGSDGKTIEGAIVSHMGASTTSGGGGRFTLPPFECELGKPVTVDAVVTVHDGTTVGGSAAVTPTGPSASVTITVAVEEVPADEVDSLISDLEDDVDGSGDLAARVAAFRAAMGDLDAIAADFYNMADYFDQKLREMAVDMQAMADPTKICNNRDLAYSLIQAQRQMDLYNSALAALPNVYADVVASAASDPFSAEMQMVDAEFGRAYDQKSALEGRYGSMLGGYATYQCDQSTAEAAAGQIAQGDADPDDVEGGAEGGGGVEICDDGIDNDGDQEIDECDAGCCDKNVQVTVHDCGNAADDIFQVAINGATVGLTPKGAANTFNRELSPGDHSVTITCLDDGGNPLGSDIGTACVTIVIFGNQVIGGEGLSIAYGGSATVGFNVPEGDSAPVFQKLIDGSRLGE